MKKIIALLIFITLVLSSFSACGAINKKNEVAVLWNNMSNEYQFTISDAIDRAMYIERIKYTHYDAQGVESTQLEQATTAIENGAYALVACTSNEITAIEILNKARDADIPVVFLCNEKVVDNALSVFNYEKCFIVNVDFDNLNVALGTKIATDLVDNYEKYDRDNDGVITYASFGTNFTLTNETHTLIKEINKILVDKGKPELVSKKNWDLGDVGLTAIIDDLFKDYDGSGNSVPATPVELILTDNDEYVEELLLALRKYELNHNKLVTHFIPLYTVGVSANAGDLLDTDNQEEKDAFSVMNAIDKGWLSASALEDDDTLAISTCKILANLIKGKGATEKIDENLVDGRTISVPYAIYD